jgi:hypothetical protein
MGRIREPELRALAERWSPVVRSLLDELGERMWPPAKIRYSLLRKPCVIKRHLIEGPVRQGRRLTWALSHTSKPSVFDDRGRLSQGERKYWILTLDSTNPASFHMEGTGVVEGVPAEESALREAIEAAGQQGPKVDNFYGNKGPLTQR